MVTFQSVVYHLLGEDRGQGGLLRWGIWGVSVP